MPIFLVTHTTAYRYANKVRFGEHRLMFRPRDSYDQEFLDSTLIVEPQPSVVRWIHDIFGNCVAVLNFTTAAKRAEVRNADSLGPYAAGHARLSNR